MAQSYSKGLNPGNVFSTPHLEEALSPSRSHLCILILQEQKNNLFFT